MKIIGKRLLIPVIFLIFPVNVLFCQVAVNPTGAPPASSAMLDIGKTYGMSVRCVRDF